MLVRYTPHSLIAVSLYGDGTPSVVLCLFARLQNTVGYTLRMLEMLLAPEIRQCLVFPKRTLGLAAVAIDVFAGSDLLVHRNAKQRGQTEIHGSKVVGIQFREVVFGELEIIVAVVVRIHVELDTLHMIGHDGVYHLLF